MRTDAVRRRDDELRRLREIGATADGAVGDPAPPALWRWRCSGGRTDVGYMLTAALSGLECTIDLAALAVAALTVGVFALDTPLPAHGTPRWPPPPA